jgi:hypothetical protein
MSPRVGVGKHRLLMPFMSITLCPFISLHFTLTVLDLCVFHSIGKILPFHRKTILYQCNGLGYDERLLKGDVT